MTKLFSNTDQPDLISLRGQLERITFTNESNGYTIAKVKVRGFNESVTIVGNIQAPNPGTILEMKGEWTTHPKFGKQFKVSSCICSVPASTSGIEKYLSSGLIRGVGMSVARRIVREFGEKTLDIIDQSPDLLLKIPGIGEHRVRMIKEAWSEQKEIRSVLIFLQEHGISTTFATKIYKKYGNDSIAIVQNNPYRLSYDIFGIGFATADKIAQQLGIDPKSAIRAEAGILFVLQETTTEGHVFYPADELIRRSKEILTIEEDILHEALGRLTRIKKVVVEQVVIEGSNGLVVFLKTHHDAETRIARGIRMICAFARKSDALLAKWRENADGATATESPLDWVQRKLNIVLAAKQIEAVNAAIEQKVLVITGSPGTGKTTIIRAILEILFCLTDKICLAAPTGRAAKRMTEATGHAAKTIHRLLECNSVGGGFMRCEDNPLDCDFLILDEASMIDVILMHSLMRAVPEHTTLILVGDTNQLPSVGPGCVLDDIIKSKVVKVVELNEIFRQAQQSAIIVSAHNIIHGIPPDTGNQENTDFFFMPEEDQEAICKKIVFLVKRRIPERFGYSPLDVQVLTPMHKGLVGTGNLNEILQQAINPYGKELPRGDRKFRVGDKVMQIKNNYDKGVFNGDIGVIEKIDLEEQEVVVNIDGESVRYNHYELEELTLSYAISIHKSQGSEFPAVVIPLTMMHYIMLQRNLIYTGITRGKKLVVVIGSKQALAHAVRNNRVMNRNTYLFQRLIDEGRSPYDADLKF
jgi:exodeoxyribonuclease V alpha subunit